MIYLKLFWSFIQVGFFSIGGGYASMPLIQNQVVEINNWLSLEEFVDLITIAEMTPGPIAVNSSTFVGIRIAGIFGAIVATIGCILPSIIIVLTFAILYSKHKKLSLVQGVLSGLKPAVVALIFRAGFSIILMAFFETNIIDKIHINDVNIISLVLFVLSIIVLRKYRPNPIYVILGSGILGSIAYMIF